MTRARGQSRPRFRLLPTVLLTLAILGLPTVVYAWGRTSSSFDIKTVRVSGTRLVPTKKALKLLRASYVGDNLFAVTAADVRGTLKPLSFVQAASVNRDFPDTLAVTITEHRPAAYALAGSRWFVLDEDGYVICTSAAAADQLGGGSRAAHAGDASPSPGAATATASSGATATPSPAAATPGATATPSAGATASATGGDESTGTTASSATSGADTASAGESGGLTARLVAGPPDARLPLPRIAVSSRAREGVALTDTATAEMLQVITALPDSYRRRLAAVEDDGGQITLRFAGGPVATWGDARRTLAKTVALRTVLAEYEKAGKTCTQIDVSIPDRTLAKPVLE
ncbi:MAG TPA: FtsQ-type POTRA domain-containing protein [Thermoleophilia bacterium]|nr:FtsQ-type POTRA domain-containing protein [Thermoleophilia bacterium]